MRRHVAQVERSRAAHPVGVLHVVERERLVAARRRWHQPVSLWRLARLLRPLLPQTVQHRPKLRHRRRPEQRTQRHPNAKVLADAPKHANGKQRMSAERHEALAGADALTLEETIGMVAYRCERAGVMNTFTRGTLEEIWQRSRGVPREAWPLASALILRTCNPVQSPSGPQRAARAR